ncbi:MAG: hypothetical protein HKO98_04380 [Gemmatimonadetes bacterium]|nr:hypothetical protein [Gemmatimonadota bacterium]
MRIDRSPRETRLFSGFTTSGGTQLLLGAATDLGPLSNRWSSLHLIPSFTFGSGEGRPSYLAQLALEFRSREVEISGVAVEPMLSLGAGLFRAGDFEAVVPTFAGATLDFNGEEPHVLDGLFLGVQGVDFLNGGRLLIGLRSGN